MNIVKSAFALVLCFMSLLVISHHAAVADANSDCNSICNAESAPGGWCNGYCASSSDGSSFYCHCAGNDACFDPNFMIGSQDPCSGLLEN